MDLSLIPSPKNSSTPAAIPIAITISLNVNSRCWPGIIVVAFARLTGIVKLCQLTSSL